MKHISIAAGLLIIACLTPLPASRAGLSDVIQGAQKVLGLGSEEQPSEGTIIEALKEALRNGTAAAVSAVSKPGGFLENPDIRIPLPESLQTVSKYLKAAGFEKQLTEFKTSMNRAAEAAAPKAKEIFVEAVREMKFEDAKKILKGDDTEATSYFRAKTYDKLSTAFKPMVHDAMAQVGVTSKYQQLTAQADQIPLLNNVVVDLDEYVTQGTMEGLFQTLAEEEKKIRQDPTSRISELLKKVI